jgi:hypothetical protein
MKTNKKINLQNESLTNKLGLKFAQASPTMFFRTFILFCVLVVATISILKGVFDTNVWTFLGTVIIYAALNKGQ